MNTLSRMVCSNHTQGDARMKIQFRLMDPYKKSNALPTGTYTTPLEVCAHALIREGVGSGFVLHTFRTYRDWGNTQNYFRVIEYVPIQSSVVNESVLVRRGKEVFITDSEDLFHERFTYLMLQPPEGVTFLKYERTATVRESFFQKPQMEHLVTFWSGPLLPGTVAHLRAKHAINQYRL
jgi:hypothetical protein